MNHYWTAADPVPTRQAQLDDWLEDLDEFGPDIVRVACAEWRQRETRRPTPGDIYRLCCAEQQRRMPPPTRLPPSYDWHPPTEQEKREVSELVQKAVAALRRQ